MKKTLCLMLTALFLLTACQQEAEEPVEMKPLGDPPAEETPVVTQPEEVKVNALPKEIFMSPADTDFWQADGWEIFEEHFYGVWRYTDDSRMRILNSDVVLTYQLAQNVGEYPLGFAETETDWYMQVFNGGTGDLYRISKDVSTLMYVYYEFPGNSDMEYDDYHLKLQKVRLHENYRVNYPVEITTGPMSTFAVRKLNQELGCVLNYQGSITTDDGTLWQTHPWDDDPYYLEEMPTAERISYFRCAYPSNAILDGARDEYRNEPWARINIVAEKVDGEWKQTSANIATLEQELDVIAYQEALSREIWGEFEIGVWSALDYEAVTTAEGWDGELYRLTDPNYYTEENFLNYLRTAFTEESAVEVYERFLGSQLFVDAEGYLCGTSGARGGNIYAGELEREITANDGKTATIHYICHTAEYALEDVGEEILEEYDIKAVYTDLGWRLVDFYWPY